MAEEKKLKRGWVKNVAIIFLAVLLVLTFFSNTIMNRSLPEVAVQYTQAGTITAKIRGTGTVTANSSYNVSVEQTRKVASVAVKVGDTVAVGDLLFTLADEESKELKAAKEQLDALNLQYRIDQINANSAYTDDQKAIADAQDALNQAIAKRDQYGGSSSVAVEAAKAEIADLEDEINRLKNKQAETGYSDVTEAALKAQERSIEDKEYEIANPSSDADIQALKRELERLNEDYDAMREAARYGDKIADAESELAVAKTNLETLEANSTNWTAADTEVASAQKTLNDLIYQLEQKQKVDGSITNLNLEASRKKIAEQQKVVNELQQESVNAEITAPMAGVVTTINVAAGDTTGAEQPMAVIEANDLGYTVSFPVTVAQAKTLKLGDPAEVSGYYWGPEIKAVLTAIKNDPENPGKNKILNFTVSGEEVTAGSQLSLTIGQKSEDYPTIVPNSAVRNDTNGDFVLIVEAKSTPLGNRYIARRVDVQVLAKDDINTAVSGGLTTSDYVITTSSKPLEPGMQVRLVEN